MIKFKHLSLRNFLSVGAVTQSVSFDQNDLVLVLGENLDLGGDAGGARNGVGKTVLINALSYALFGKGVSNISKDNLINKTNGKGMLVTLDFEIDGQSYRIERARKPTYLKFFVNNVEQKSDATTDKKDTKDEAQGDSRETQADIEKRISMSHDMFKNIVALNTYSEPFLSQRVSDQRTIIEQLLGITMLSEKAEILKNQVKASKEAVSLESMRLKTIQESNARIQKQIESLVLKESAWNKSKETDITSLTDAYQELEALDVDQEIKNHKLLSEYITQSQALDQVNSDYRKQKSLLDKEEKLFINIAEEIKLLAEGICHTCNQALTDHDHQQLLSAKLSQQIETKKHCDNYQAELAALTFKKENLGVLPEVKPEVFYTDIQDAYDHKNKIEMIIQQIESRDAEVNPFSDQIADMKSQALQEVDYSSVNELNKIQDHQEFLLKLLTSKDSFIRKKIIDQNLSYLNTRLAFYLGKINLPHNVVFQSDLSVDITELDRSLDFHNLSRGEMTRLSLSLSWAFRDVFENLYTRIDLLFIDEQLDQGLDQSGVENAVMILKDMNRNTGRNIWLVSHREELTNKVDRIFKVTKENGFTSFEN
jgi:DNA repair exonuclease SbcCD ATPase subunit